MANIDCYIFILIILVNQVKSNLIDDENGTFLNDVDFYNSRFVLTNIPLKPRLNDQRFYLKVCYI